MAHGELKAADRLTHRKKQIKVDIARARMRAHTEVKFRELFDGSIPKEFQIIPDPEQIFGVERIIVDEMFDHSPDNLAANGNHNLCTCRDRDPMTLGAPTYDNGSVMNRTLETSLVHSQTASLRLRQYCNMCRKPYDKHSVKAAPGMLSNNVKKSNLMNFVNKEHMEKMKTLYRQQSRDIHWKVSSSRQSRAYSVEKS